ncbi:uncharacterized protein PODANS_2_5790 [Podospora anserina S mat+]|uniref:Monoglyceride lipase n=1 Tax=Podospora anserina (strain S / ATCC MYA-4624 / DSM 980 / FGSC 10383) TaxID=515849 RepID=B2B5U4_PODAN|nr:uncharacterized protein PODANS_2_5790 [Podospora anserina S mat+]CAP73169.1 unnamed protein product [Podospora anserina S mat+]CDP25570.1 Putative monoglyceride lipase [Podospora anserina S mat+]
MVLEQEGTFTVSGAELYTKSWLPDGPIKARLVFIHGFSDHINRYPAFFSHLASKGIAVYGFDQRGWGRSVKKPAERGLTGPTAQVLSDIAAFLSQPHLLGTPGSQEPVFVMGHSMGGGQVLTFAADPKYESLVEKVRGLLLEAPFIGFSPEERPSRLKITVGRLAGRLMPHFQLAHKIAVEHLTRDQHVQVSIKEDELMHDTGTLEGFAGLLDRTNDLQQGRTKLGKEGVVKSLWVGHGTADKTTWFEATKQWFEGCAGGVKDRTLRAYEGWYHQLHCDGECSGEFFEDVAGWILERAGGGEEVLKKAGETPKAQQTQEAVVPVEAEGSQKTEAKL